MMGRVGWNKWLCCDTRDAWEISVDVAETPLERASKGRFYVSCHLIQNVLLLLVLSASDQDTFPTSFRIAIAHFGFKLGPGISFSCHEYMAFALLPSSISPFLSLHLDNITIQIWTSNTTSLVYVPFPPHLMKISARVLFGSSTIYSRLQLA